MATFQANAPSNAASERTKVVHQVKGDGGSAATPRPTTGQLWPRVKRNG